MMGVTALGALIFGLSTGPFGLLIGRTLLGVGTASAFLAGMKAVVTWLPRERLGLLTGCLITVAGLGALAMADPTALFVRTYGWRALFILLAALATLCAILAALLVPAPATVTGDVPDQDHGLPFVLRDPIFRRFAPLAAIVVGTVWAIQGQWVAGWLAAMNGLELTDIITHISLIAIGQTAGALVWGMLADWAVRKGLSAASVFVGAVALCVCIQVAAVGGIALPTSIVWGALVAGAAAMLPFVVLLTHFPQTYAARACASVGVLQYVATLFIQSAVGSVVAIWPHEASGQTSATAYAMAFMVPIALQLAALAWFLFPRSETRDGAQSVGEIAVAFELLRSAAALADFAGEPADTAVKPIGAVRQLGQAVPRPALGRGGEERADGADDGNLAPGDPPPGGRGHAEAVEGGKSEVHVGTRLARGDGDAVERDAGVGEVADAARHLVELALDVGGKDGTDAGRRRAGGAVILSDRSERRDDGRVAMRD